MQGWCSIYRKVLTIRLLDQDKPWKLDTEVCVAAEADRQKGRFVHRAFCRDV